MIDESIQSKGGKARAEKLSDERLAAIASNAAKARWAAVKTYTATHKGNFKPEFGVDVDCYVLDDPQKTTVISQTGTAVALGLSPRGNALPRLLANKALSESVSAELRGKLTQTIRFQWAPVGAETPPIKGFGYDSGLLIDICRAIEAAAPQLGSRYERIIAQARIIQGAAAKAGIRNLVYALAGYSPTTQEVIDAFKLYVQEEAKKYEKEFPPELYAQWYRLYQIPAIVGRGRPWQFKHLTVRHIYYPLAKSNGKILELVRALKAKDGDRQKKLFQFLNEVGARALRMQLGRVLEMAEDSESRGDYESRINRRFGDQQEFDFGDRPAA